MEVFTFYGTLAFRSSWFFLALSPFIGLWQPDMCIYPRGNPLQRVAYNWGKRTPERTNYICIYPVCVFPSIGPIPNWDIFLKCKCSTVLLLIGVSIGTPLCCQGFSLKSVRKLMFRRTWHVLWSALQSRYGWCLKWLEARETEGLPEK